MNAQFDRQLSLTNGQKTVAARGPCAWEAGDKSAVVRDVTVTRKGVVASTAVSTRVLQMGVDQSWSLDVSSPNQLTTGRADAHAIAFVTRTDNTTYERRWYDDVTLQP
jgi:hypothetical protein